MEVRKKKEKGYTKQNENRQKYQRKDNKQTTLKIIRKNKEYKQNKTDNNQKRKRKLTKQNRT